MKIRTQRSALERAWDKFGEACDTFAWLAPVGLLAMLALVQWIDSLDDAPAVVVQPQTPEQQASGLVRLMMMIAAM